MHLKDTLHVLNKDIASTGDWLNNIAIHISLGIYISVHGKKPTLSEHYAHFDKDEFGSYSEFRVTYHLAERHAITFNVEKIKTSASLSNAMIRTGEFGDTLGHAYVVDEWDFSATPIGFSYEFHPKLAQETVSPFLGVGASYFFTDVKYKSWYLHDTLFGNLNSDRTRDGEGYGVHLYVGVQSKLTEHFMIFSRVRGRYADGMAFTDKKGDIKVEFTGVDFTLGVGWSF